MVSRGSFARTTGGVGTAPHPCRPPDTRRQSESRVRGAVSDSTRGVERSRLVAASASPSPSRVCGPDRERDRLSIWMGLLITGRCWGAERTLVDAKRGAARLCFAVLLKELDDSLAERVGVCPGRRTQQTAEPQRQKSQPHQEWAMLTMSGARLRAAARGPGLRSARIGKALTLDERRPGRQRVPALPPYEGPPGASGQALAASSAVDCAFLPLAPPDEPACGRRRAAPPPSWPCAHAPRILWGCSRSEFRSTYALVTRRMKACRRTATCAPCRRTMT